MIKSSITSLLLASSLLASAADTWKDICELTTLPNPKGVDPQIGALGTLPNGDLIAAFHRGEIMVYSQQKNQWLPWGAGLHEPLGMHVENQHSIVVVQRAELTRISDTDKDGQADTYQAICSSWGMSGNYHEFAFGAAKSPDGHFYVGLGTASSGGGARPEIRGEWNDAGGLTHAYIKPDWTSKRAPKMPRMYARVPYRGWIIKIDPNTGKLTPVASGLRTPHGIHVNAKGEVYVNDNQGDWLGSSKLYKIEQGKFYGHADSLIWTKGWNRGVPANLPAAELDKMRTKSLCYLPQGDLANSPTQILTLPKKGFGPYGGNIIMGEMNQARLVRYLPDVVNGKQQGAALKFFEHPKLGRGNSKLSLGENGTIYVGKTHLSWAGASGLAAIKYNQTPHLAINQIALTSTGFKVTLNEPADTSNIQLKGTRYGILYHSKYGSPKIKPTALKATSIHAKGKVIDIVLEQNPVADQVYDIELTGVISKQLGKLIEPRFFYTAHEVIQSAPKTVTKTVAKITPPQAPEVFAPEVFAPEVFVFENAFRDRSTPALRQAALLKQFGYDGIGSVSEKGALEKLKTYQKAGIKVYSIYGGGQVTGKTYQYDRKNWSAIMKQLKGSNTIIEFYIRGPRDNNPAAQAQAAKMMQEVADLASAEGLKVVIYPHSGNYVAATFRQAVDVARLANRKNLGVMFNLCHFLKEHPNASSALLEKELNHAGKLLWAVSTSGADGGASTWDKLIQPLNSGTYDQEHLFTTLKKMGFRGHLGLQCYAIKQTPEDFLKGSAEALKKISKNVYPSIDPSKKD